MARFRSTSQNVDITWTDTQTGQQHTTTDCYIPPQTGATPGKEVPLLVAASELTANDVDRVQIDKITRR